MLDLLTDDCCVDEEFAADQAAIGCVDLRLDRTIGRIAALMAIIEPGDDESAIGEALEFAVPA